MAPPQTRGRGAYPLQTHSAFEPPQSAPSKPTQPSSNSYRSPRPGSGAREAPWSPSSDPLAAHLVEAMSAASNDPSRGRASPVQVASSSVPTAKQSSTRSTSRSYPLQSMPICNTTLLNPTTWQPKAPAPESVPSVPQSVSSMPQRQSTEPRQAGFRDQAKPRHRTLSQSYPLQARPSQIFRDDMDLSPRTSVSKSSGADEKSSPSPAVIATPSSPRQGYYGAQIMPVLRSAQPTSAPPVKQPVTEEARTTAIHNREQASQVLPRLRQPYPSHMASAKSASPSERPAIQTSQAQQKKANLAHSPYPLQMPPSPPYESDQETAISSARASQDHMKRRQPYPFQPFAQDSAEFQVSNQPLSDENKSKAYSSTQDSSNWLPRLPRNVRALKDGKNTQLPGRTIVICLDGTGDKFDSDNSNIVHLVSCLKKSDPSQVTYYQSGIGTYDGGGLSNGLNAALDMAVGSGLGVHVRDAYHFLMQNYVEGDRICLFGFSRGAYTARCLAGMVHKVGLLPAHNVQQLPFAYEYYKDDSEDGWEMSGDFKRTFCMDVSVHFIGVFDSVASVGFIPRTLPLSATPWNKATYFRHALALDEHRAKFKAKHFEQKDSIDPNARWQTIADSHDGDGAVDADTGRRASNKRSFDLSEIAEDGQPIEADSYIRQKRALAQAKKTDVLEVWFAGAHADVGGGAEKNNVRHKLAQIPLRWMLRQCFECDTGILFKVHRLAEEGLDIHTLWPKYTSLGIPRMGPSPSLLEKHEHGKIAPICRRSSVLQPADKNNPQGPHDVVIWRDPEHRQLHEDWVPEHVEDYFDSISRVNDQLVGATIWWILEVWPIKVRVQASNSDEWVKRISMNLGRYRAVQDSAPNLHWTVQRRIEAMGYKLNVRLGRNACWNLVA